MKIILKYIPAHTRKQDIYNFIAPALKGGLFRQNGKIVDISLLIYKNSSLNSFIHHGLVDIRPDAAASRTIKKLNRKMFKGKHIGVQEYHLRSWRNDRRYRNKFDDLVPDDRRIADRRNRALVRQEEESDPEIFSHQVFHRLHK